MTYTGSLQILRLLLALAVLVSLSVPSANTFAEPRQIVTFSIQYGDPENMRAVVASQLSPGSSVSLYQRQLIVNATSEELRRVRELIGQLDARGQQLLISVKTAGDGGRQQQQVRVSGSVQAGAHTETTTRTTVTVRDFQSTSSGRGAQGVRATEGQPAYISTGASAPINSYRTTISGKVVRDQEYVDANTGFYATAWISGSSVRVRIDQRREQLKGRVIEGQQLQTEVSGALGQWIPIGMISKSQRSSSSDLIGYSKGGATSAETIFLKVERLD